MTQQPLQFGDLKGKEKAILEQKKNILLDRIRKYKMGIFNSNEQIGKIEKRLKFLNKINDKTKN